MQENFSRLSDSEPLVQGMRGETVRLTEDEKKQLPFPDFERADKQLEALSAFSENRKMYFQGLTIMPTNIKLSVAPPEL